MKTQFGYLGLSSTKPDFYRSIKKVAINAEVSREGGELTLCTPFVFARGVRLGLTWVGLGLSYFSVRLKLS